MNTIIKFGALCSVTVLAAAFLTACNDPDDVKKPTPETQEQYIMISATLNAESNSNKTAWNAGDAFNMFSEQSNKGTFVATTEEGASADFEGLAIDGNTFFGYYPATEGVTFANSTIEAPLAATAACVTELSGLAVPMAGKGDIMGGIAFYPLCVPVTLTVEGSCMLHSLVIESTSDICGVLTVDLSGNKPSASVAGGKSISVADIDTTVGGTTSFHICMLAGTYPSLKLKLTDMGGATAEQSFTNTTIAADRNNDFKIEYSSTVDLSTAGTSNCYIVSGAGTYRFATKLHDGTLKEGNGATCLWSDVKCSVDKNVVTKVASTDIADNAEYIIKNIAYDPDKDIISFEATGNVGNAVIALYTEASGVKQIVWSWHIWATGTTNMVVRNWQSSLLADEDKTIDWLDRNIGATASARTDVSSVGLVYQAGRKDPFIGASALSGASETTAFTTLSRPTYCNAELSAGFTTLRNSVAVATAIAQPMTLFCSAAAVGGGFNNWTEEAGATLNWNEKEATFVDVEKWLTDAPASGETCYLDGALSTAKTNYDPCPVGWRVPTAEEMWLSFMKTTSGGFLSNVDVSSPTGSDFSRTLTDINGKTIDFPASGNRGAGNSLGKMQTPGKASYYWTGTQTKDLSCGRFVLGASALKQALGSPAAAYAVRCVAERTNE